MTIAFDGDIVSNLSITLSEAGTRWWLGPSRDPARPNHYVIVGPHWKAPSVILYVHRAALAPHIWRED